MRENNKLIYSMLVSLDGYTEDKNGKFGWGAPDDEDVHTYINQLGASIGTYLYGRKMYETMVYWETAHTVPDQPKVGLEFARQWQAAEKIVFSRTLVKPSSAKTKIERNFEADVVTQLKENTTKNISIDGPHLAAQALKASLVDEIQIILCPVIVGGGNPFFPKDVHFNLKLTDERRFEKSGVVVLRYNVIK